MPLESTWSHTFIKYIAYGSGYVDGVTAPEAPVNWARVGAFAAAGLGSTALTVVSLLHFYHPFPRGHYSRSPRSTPFAAGAEPTDPQLLNQFYTNVDEFNFVTLSQGRVRYFLRGPNVQKDATSRPVLTDPKARVVVLVHGFSIASDIWKQQADYLVAKGFNVLSFDNYGRGWSDAPDVPYEESLYIGQISELLYALRISSPIDLIGVSMGGAIVAAYTALYPTRVARLCMVCPAGLPIKAPPSMMKRVTWPLLGPLFFKRELPYMQAKGAAAQWEVKDSPMYKAWGAFARQNAVEHKGFIRCLYRTVCNFDMNDSNHHYDELAKQTGMKTLIIWGEKDGLTPYENGTLLQSLIPHSQFVTVRDAKHNFLIERGQVVAEILGEWLKDSDKQLRKKVRHHIDETEEVDEAQANEQVPAAAAPQQ